MLEFINLTKTYRLEHGKRKVIFENISFAFPEGKNIALLGGNGAGKSTTLRLIAGSDFPDSGRIIRSRRLSWPLGFTGGFHNSLTGEENLRFICRIYGADLKAVKAYVEEFAELGEYLYQPINTYSSGMRARLAFGLSLAIEFDVYLIDELTGVGDAQFRKKSKEEFKKLRERSNIIMASHSMSTLREYCDIALLLKDGHMHIYENIEEGIAAYQGNDINAKSNNTSSVIITQKDDLKLIKKLQFHYISEKLKIFQNEGQPVILVDTKRKRPIHNSEINEQEDNLKIKTHEIDICEFLEKEKGEVDSLGIYNLARDKGWVSVGIILDEIQFTIHSIRNWWYDKEMNACLDATKLYILYLDAGRDVQNNKIVKIWNAELQKLANELKLTIHVSFIPRGGGARRWNLVKNRLFSFYIQNHEEKFLINKATVVSLIGKAESDDELKIKAKLDNIEYQKNSEKPADVNSQADDFYGKWNYRIYPI